MYNCTEEGVFSSGIGLGLWQVFVAIQKVFVQFETVQDVVSTLIHNIIVKLGDKERFDKEQIGVKKPFLVTNCQFTS